MDRGAKWTEFGLLVLHVNNKKIYPYYLKSDEWVVFSTSKQFGITPPGYRETTHVLTITNNARGSEVLLWNVRVNSWLRERSNIISRPEKGGGVQSMCDKSVRQGGDPPDVW